LKMPPNTAEATFNADLHAKCDSSGLEVKPFAPVAMVFITSGELKITAKRHAQSSGMLVVSSDELYTLCIKYWKRSGIEVPKTRRSFLARLRKEGKDLPIAR